MSYFFFVCLFFMDIFHKIFGGKVNSSGAVLSGSELFAHANFSVIGV